MSDKNKPFQQHQAPTPSGHKVGQKWFRRHIIFDHTHKTVFIQIMWDGDGYSSLKEMAEINAGGWFNYVPTKMIEEVRQAKQSGYTIKPVAVMGDAIGEEYLVMQLVDIKDGTMSTEQSLITPVVDRSKIS